MRISETEFEEETDSETELDFNEEENRLLQIEKLREQGEKVPRRLRTRDLGITSTYCEHWEPQDGIRELIQNFFDGLCSAHDKELEDMVFERVTGGGPGKKEWKELWIARPKENSKVEYGKITMNHKNKDLILRVRCKSLHSRCIYIQYLTCSNYYDALE